MKTFGIICEQKYCRNQTRIDIVQGTCTCTSLLLIVIILISLSPSGQLVPQYITELDNKLHFARMGASLGLGALPKEILEGQLDTVM